jgi:uncharacterized protein DUF2252
MKRRSRALTTIFLGAVCISASLITFPSASAQTTSPGGPFGQRASFRLNKSALRAQGASSGLLERLSVNAYRYFRLLARQFAARTCYEFRALRWHLPSVAVHGDAHLEQFVVTDAAYGLADFDRAGYGSAVVDLVRFASSMHLACRDATWSCDPDQAVSVYFSAYRAALDHPVTRSQPAIVDRIRLGASQNRRAWLQWADGLMQPLLPTAERALRSGWPQFVELMRATAPERPDAFYTIARLGSVEIGIGSALEPKTMIRIAGPSEDPDDDLLLEARVSATSDEQDCVSRPVNGGSLHVVMFSALLGQRLPDVFGFLPREDARDAPELWIQSWDSGHRELALTDLRSQSDLNELATDAGGQLGGHFWTMFPEPLRGHQRFAQLRAFEMSERRARELARELADETVSEWNRFRRQR